MILVTGATGFLGRNVCEHLARQGYALRALVRPTSDITFLGPLGAEVAVGDILDYNSVAAAMEGCDYVVHAAARFRLWGPPEPFILTNIEGTRRVLEAARAVGVKKFIHISTIIVVGPQPPGAVITEQTPCRPYPTDNYAKTKFIGEKLALSYARQGLPVTVLRLGALYGPYGHYAFNRLFFEEFLRNWRVQVHHGRHIIFPCYVGDAARAIELALERGRPGEIYNISNRSLSHRDANRIVSRLAGRSSWRVNVPGWMMKKFARLLEFVARFTGQEPFYPLNLEPYVFCDWVVNCNKARQELAFRPSTFTEGARCTLEWYRSVGYV